MLYGENRSDHREVLFNAWNKFQDKKPLDPMGKKILQIILDHPEYHKIFNQHDTYIDRDFSEEMGEINPFLHLSLHLTILEQIQINQPLGITSLYKQAVERFQDRHDADHCLMHSLTFEMFEVINNKKPFNEKQYLKRIKTTLKRGYW